MAGSYGYCGIIYVLPCYFAARYARRSALCPAGIRAFALAYFAKRLNTDRNTSQKKRSEAFDNLICFFSFHIDVRKLF